MKKIIVILIAVIALLCTVAYADELVTREINGKVSLWEREITLTDLHGKEARMPILITLKVKEPVKLTLLPAVEAYTDQVYMAKVEREGVAQAYIAVTSAKRGLHHNLNNYTNEKLQEYINSVIYTSFDSENSRSEVRESAGGNTYVMVDADYARMLSTIYENFRIEIYLTKPNTSDPNNIVFEPLTDKDKAFGLEIFQGIWLETPAGPATDYELTYSLNKSFMEEYGLMEYALLADSIENTSVVFHIQSDLGRISLVSGDKDLLNLSIIPQGKGIEIQSNLLGSKALFISYDKLKEFGFGKNLSEKALDETVLAEAAQVFLSINFDKTTAAIQDSLSSVERKDGTLVFSLPTEKVMTVVQTFIDDVTASGAVTVLTSLLGGAKNGVDFNAFFNALAAEYSDFLPESGNLLDLTLSGGKNGSPLEINGTLNYCTTEYAGYDTAAKQFRYEKKKHIISFVSVVSSNDEDFLLSSSATFDSANLESVLGARYDLKIDADALIESELTLGRFSGNTLTPFFSISFFTDAPSVDTGDEQSFILSLNLPDDQGNMNGMFSFTGKRVESDGFHIAYLYTNLFGYDDPVAAMTFNSKFGEEIDAESAAEVYNIEELTDKDVDELISLAFSNLSASFSEE